MRVQGLPAPFVLLRIGAGAGQVVLVAGVEAAEIEFAIDEVVQGMFEGAGQELRLQIHGNEARAGVDGFVAGHGVVSVSDLLITLDVADGSRQDARMKRLFLQLRWGLP